jgi:DnaJ-class molecular chaperone
MPKVTVCKKCSGTGKIEHKSKKKSPDEATIFLLCRSCNGTGWLVTPEKDETASAKGPIDVKAELNALNSVGQGVHDLTPYLTLLIRLIDERFPLKGKGK